MLERGLLLFLAASLTACTAVPPAAPPSFALPPVQAADCPVCDRWWTAFGDPVLDALQAEAVAASQDLVLAAARVDEASALWRAAEAPRYPAADIVVRAGRGRNPPQTPAPATTLLAGVQASWQLDFWRRYRHAGTAARARLLAEESARTAVLDGLHAGVANAYVTLRALDAQVELATSTLEVRRAAQALQDARYSRGAIAEIDWRQAQGETAQAEAALQQAGQARAVAEAALATLLGRSPAAIAAPDVARGATISELQRAGLPAAVPSDLLRRRPDLRQAEQLLAAADADAAAARAAYFPSIDLALTAGTAGRSWGTLLHPATQLWNVAAGVVQPLTRGGAIDAEVAGAQARRRQATARYVQAVQRAFQDSHDAMTRYRHGAGVIVALERRIDALRRTQELAELRYQAGRSGYLDVLNAQRDLLQARTELIDAQRARLSGLIDVFLALGPSAN